MFVELMGRSDFRGHFNGILEDAKSLPEGINLHASGRPVPFRVLAGVGGLASLCPEGGTAIE